MPRHPDGAVARAERITIRMDEDEKAELDWKRGRQDRSSYVRGLIHADGSTKETHAEPES
jgi:hypothetical protein